VHAITDVAAIYFAFLHDLQFGLASSASAAASLPSINSLVDNVVLCYDYITQIIAIVEY
jgi:hypothetical protein